jgi:hypothetical protein
MPQKKSTKVGTLEYPQANIKLDITVDRDSMLFWVSYGGTRYEHKDGQELRRIVFDAIKASLDVEWMPVIVVEPIGDRFGSSLGNEYTLGFTTERMWVARFPDGHYKRTQWHAQGDQKLQWSQSLGWQTEKWGEFEPPCIGKEYSKATHYLPYSEPLWDNLQLLREKIKHLRSEFFALLGTREGIDFLTSTTVSLALPSPKAATTREEG